LQQYAASDINTVFQKVTFPVFSSIQDENLRLKKGYKITIKGLVYFNFPLMLGLIAIANPLVRVLLTEKWLPCVPYFQLLCLAGFLYPLHSLNLNIIKVKGRSDLFLKLEIIKKILIIVAIFFSLPFGIMALLIGQSITSFISYFINSYYSGRLINYRIKEQIYDILPSIIASVGMGLSTWLIGLILGDHYVLKLLIQIIWAICLYFIMSKILKLEALEELLSITKTTFIRQKLFKMIGR
jgi:O-antigen/teichoic acid export membrane protein